MKPDVYQNVTNKLLALMQEHGTDWIKPWTSQGAHKNVISHKSYRGVNTFLTGLASASNGYGSNEWGTYKQWQGKEAQVRKGERSTSIVFWKPMERENENGEIDKYFLCRFYSVFNADQVDGYESPVIERATKNEIIKRGEAFMSGTGANIRHDGGKAFYSPSRDMIVLPPLQNFDNSESYYSTAFHELTHWTGHKDRLDRKFGASHGNPDYAAEELVAETGAALLSVSLGLAPEPRADHAKYLNNWLAALHNDKRFVFAAFSKAQRAVDYMDGLQEEIPIAA